MQRMLYFSCFNYTYAFIKQEIISNMSAQKEGQPKDPTTKTWTSKNDEDYKPSSSLKIDPDTKPSIITRSFIKNMKRKQSTDDCTQQDQPTSTFHKTPTVKHPVTLFPEGKPSHSALKNNKMMQIKYDYD